MGKTAYEKVQTVNSNIVEQLHLFRRKNGLEGKEQLIYDYRLFGVSPVAVFIKPFSICIENGPALKN